MDQLEKHQILIEQKINDTDIRLKKSSVDYLIIKNSRNVQRIKTVT